MPVRFEQTKLYKVTVWKRGRFDYPTEVIIRAPNANAAKRKAEHELGLVIKIERHRGYESPIYQTFER